MQSKAFSVYAYDDHFLSASEFVSASESVSVGVRVFHLPRKLSHVNNISLFVYVYVCTDNEQVLSLVCENDM